MTHPHADLTAGHRQERRAIRRRPLSNRVSPVLEPLERRTLLVGNLTITNAFLVDSNDHAITAPAVGEMVFIQANWRTTNLTSTDVYVISYVVDGVTLNSATQTGSPGTNLGFFWYRGGWFASPGSHSVQVIVDGTNAVAETNETDNTRTLGFSPEEPATLPQKLAQPIGGVPYKDWTVVNYVDVNPTSQITDYLGGPISYDGHNGYDLSLANFARMDAGLPIFAASSGVVTNVADGNFDRQTAFNTDPANFITVDLGNGWTTQYFHLLRTSPAVKVGDVITTGQFLGLVGSAGNSTGAHLHFALYHNGGLVETYFEPNAYWTAPLTYQANVPTSILDLGISNSSVFNDMKERPDSLTVFPTSSSDSVWYWYVISSMNPTDTMSVNWYRPNETLATSFPFTTTSVIRDGSFGWSLNRSVWSTAIGTWNVATVVNGVEIGRAAFQVTSSTGAAVIKLSPGTPYILNNRTTPIDFGTVAQGGTALQKTFTIQNIGYATLTTSGPVLPPGFSLVGSFPSSIAAGGSASFTVQIDATVAGSKFGQVRFATNDADDSVFGFNISGTVSGAAPANAALITLSAPALATDFNPAPRPLDPGATVVDANSANFASGRLTVELASGGTTDDRLSILNGGTGAGQVGFDGTTVTFGGIVIGTATTGTSPTSLTVAFNASATVTAVQSLLRNITYSNVSTIPTSRPRYVRFTIVDDTGLTSNLAVKTVDNSGVNRAPVSGTAAGPYSVTEGQSLSLTGTAGFDIDGDPLSYSWDLNGDGIFGDALGLNPTLTWAQLLSLGIDHSPQTIPTVRLRVSDGVNAPVVSAPTSLTVADAAPAVVLGPDATITRGAILIRPGQFTDPGKDTWMATVDYGDGGGPQALALNPDKTFSLVHTYTTTSTASFTITVKVSDAGGTGVATLGVAVPTPIAIAGVQVKDGSPQRSMVDDLSIRFASPVIALDPGAIQVVLAGGVSPTTLVTFDPTGTVATLKFSGPDIVAGSLPDGNYTLTIDSTKVHDDTGGLLDGDGDGLSGGTYTGFAFFRLFGDTDGDRDVDNLDYLALRNTYSSHVADVVYIWYLDQDGNGVIDATDRDLFLRRRGTRLDA